MYYLDSNILRPLTANCRLSYSELAGPRQVLWSDTKLILVYADRCWVGFWCFLFLFLVLSLTVTLPFATGQHKSSPSLLLTIIIMLQEKQG